MWYLVTFEAYDFIKVNIKQKDTQYTLDRSEDTRTFSVSGGNEYEYVVNDDNPEAYRLNELNALNPFGCILINHATVLVRWEDSIKNLESRVKSVFHNKDKYFIVEIAENAATNLFSEEQLNIIFKMKGSKTQ